MVIKICHNGIKYKSKKDFELYAKDLIYNKIGCCSSVSNTNYFNELFTFLRRHPDEDKLSGMIDFKVSVNKLNRKAYEIYVLKNDGTETDISWRCAISGKSYSKNWELNSAFRSSISYQIMEFRNSHDNVCDMCSSDNTNIHIDHVNHFVLLTKDFIGLMKKENIVVPIKFRKLDDGTNRHTFSEEDDYFCSRWKEYHRLNAELRVLCADCNLTRTKLR